MYFINKSSDWYKQKQSRDWYKQKQKVTGINKSLSVYDTDINKVSISDKRKYKQSKPSGKGLL